MDVTCGIMDRTIARIDRIMRRQAREFGKDGIGFDTQLVLFLDGAADLEQLERMTRRFAGQLHRMSWEVIATGECADSDILRRCSRLFSSPRGSSRETLLMLYLFERTDEGGERHDVLLIQYSHLLMDIHGAIPLIKELSRCGREAGSRMEHHPSRGDFLLEKLAVLGRSTRCKTAWASLSTWLYLLAFGGTSYIRHSPSRLHEAHSKSACRYLTHVMSRKDFLLHKSALRAAFGFVSPSMSILASAFRGVRAMLPLPPELPCPLTVGLGVDLGVRGRKFRFGNFVSILPITTSLMASNNSDEERGALVKALGSQLRSRLAQKQDWGLVQAASWLERIPFALDVMLTMVVKRSLSFYYAYFGSFDEIDAPLSILGRRIRDIRIFAPSAPPAGVSFTAQEYRGRLILQMAYRPAFISDANARELMSRVCDDIWRASHNGRARTHYSRGNSGPMTNPSFCE